MQIVLPGALPDADTARALAPHMQRAAPTLQRWRARGRVQTKPAATAQAACTAYEQWQLAQRGFVPDADQNISAGLGALLAGPEMTTTPAADEPVWLAELVHIVLASDGAALVPARRLDISADDSRALIASAQTVCAGTGFRLEPHSTSHWRVIPDEPLQRLPLHCASPELVATSSVHDWWPQHAQARAWRQVFNALQMHWFDHPVNHARAARGAAPINGLWLFGGARPAQLRGVPAPDTDIQIHDSLLDPWVQHDWGAWLAALADLERTVFAPLGAPPQSLVLIGGEEIVEVSPAPRWWDLNVRFWRNAFKAA